MKRRALALPRNPWPWLLVGLFCGNLALAAPPRVEFDVVTPQASAQLSAQQWLRVLTELNVAGLRIRPARAGDKAGVENQGTPDQPSYKVTAVLNQRNELELPGGRFGLNDRARLADWIKQLREQGPPGSPRKRAPFGLSPDQLGQLDSALRKPLTVDTLGQSRMEVVSAVERLTGLSIVLDDQARQALRDAGPVTDSLRGMACGTSLAAAVRPAGLAVAPRASDRRGVELVVMRPARGAEIWPVGFPAEQRREQLVPLLFESITVEIEGNPLGEALEAIAARLQVPFLFDHNALAAEQIDLKTTTVTLPAKRLSYSLILRRLLGQAKLASELRIDDAGRPFLWITTFRNLSGRGN